MRLERSCICRSHGRVREMNTISSMKLKMNWYSNGVESSGRPFNAGKMDLAVEKDSRPGL